MNNKLSLSHNSRALDTRCSAVRLTRLIGKVKSSANNASCYCSHHAWSIIVGMLYYWITFHVISLRGAARTISPYVRATLSQIWSYQTMFLPIVFLLINKRYFVESYSDSCSNVRKQYSSTMAVGFNSDDVPYSLQSGYISILPLFDIWCDIVFFLASVCSGPIILQCNVIQFSRHCSQDW